MKYPFLNDEIAVGISIDNTVTVSATQSDPDPSNNTANTFTPAAASADLSIAKSASPASVFLGQDLTYTITVTNKGPSNATDVVVTDTLPDTVTFKSADHGGTLSGNKVTFNLGTVKKNDPPVILTIVVNVNP